MAAEGKAETLTYVYVKQDAAWKASVKLEKHSIATMLKEADGSELG